MKKYFYGHYFKLQSKDNTIALIPSYSKYNNEYKSSLQIITSNESYLISYKYDEYEKYKGFEVKIGSNIFNKDGIILNIDRDDLKVEGKIEFKEFKKLNSNIMGPFKFIPFMECVHEVVSIKHRVNGYIKINGINYEFNDDSYGYIEGDKGRSFPSVYIWTHANLKSGSIMLSVADIPFGLFHFTGLIGFIYHDNKIIRLGTYYFARALKISDNEVIIKQGKYKLFIKLIKRNEFPLKAPIVGKMDRIIKESAECIVEYKLLKNDIIIFQEVVNNASMEYEYTKNKEFNKLDKKK